MSRVVGLNAYVRSHQPFWSWELLLGTDSCEGLTVRYTHFRNKNFLNLPSIMLSITFNDIYQREDTDHVYAVVRTGPRAACRPRAPCWWLLAYVIFSNGIARPKKSGTTFSPGPNSRHGDSVYFHVWWNKSTMLCVHTSRSTLTLKPPCWKWLL